MGSLFRELCSSPTLLRGFDRVEENRGCAGVDGQTIEDFSVHRNDNLEVLRDELRTGRYEPLPLLRVIIEPNNAKRRSLAIPTVRDRIAQTAAALVLTPVLDPEFEDVSYGYRPGRSVDQAVARVLQLRDRGYRWVVDADIRRFFEEISHERLLDEFRKHVSEPRFLELISVWIGAEIFDDVRQVRYRMTRGIPQGSPISPLLANLYLDPFDEAHLQNRQKLIRFADDFVILCKSKPDAVKALELSDEVLEEIDLSLNRGKTRITSFEQGFEYLGVEFLRSLAYRPKEPDWTPRESDSSEVVDSDGIRWLEEVEDTSSGRSQYDPILRTLYLMEQGARLSIEHRRFVIRKDAVQLKKIPTLKVDQVFVFGNIQLTTPAMKFCLREEIPIFLLSRVGHYYGSIEGASDRNIVLQGAQFSAAANTQLSLEIARGLVQGKIRNGRVLLARVGRRLGNEKARAGADRMKGIEARCDGATSLESLRGYEGSAAAIYFGIWPGLLGTVWRFPGRKPRPAPDPVNALLSFGYSLLYHNVYTLLRTRGLNPYVGFLHAHRPGHAALASDLMEEFRAPVVDATVLGMLQRGQVESKDFELPKDPNGACRIGDEARRVVTRTFEAAINRPVTHPDAGRRCDYRRAILLQAERLVSVICGKQPTYRPFLRR